MPILITGLALLIYGIFAMYSVSIYESFSLTVKLIASGKLEGDPSNYFYFLRQLKNILIGSVGGILAYIIPLNFFKKEKNVIIIGALLMILQILVFIPGVGVSLNGARGWINIPLMPSMQPAEFFKLGYVIFMASWLIRKRDNLNKKEFFVSFIVLNVLLFFIFLLIPDLGTLLILGITSLIMCRYMGTKIKYILYILFGGLIGGLLIGSIAGLASERFAYIQKRFTYFLSSDVDPQSRQIGRQNQQALVAIGGGGFFGKGYGKGLQKFGYIPEAQSDFIFSAYAEEVGFIGSMILLGLYFYLGRYVLTHLGRVKSEYNKMLAVGIISLIIVQAFVNMGVNLKILPNTGLTLPFISYGGTAILINLVELMLLYKIIKYPND